MWLNNVRWGEVKWMGFFMPQSTIFQLHMWRHTDVQANSSKKKLDVRSGFHAIYISYWSVICPSKQRHGSRDFFPGSYTRVLQKETKRDKNGGPKVTKTSWSQKGWCNKPTKLQFQLILIRKILMLLKRYESTKVDSRTWLHVPSRTHWSTSSDTRQVVEIQKETSILF